ncbi:hypothetical protein COC46_21810 [Bacillus sp. AFS041924]|nr:hypothetical protein COC46_21810 [Bacillus sp. AFS041924]
MESEVPGMENQHSFLTETSILMKIRTMAHENIMVIFRVAFLKKDEIYRLQCRYTMYNNLYDLKDSWTREL